MCNLVISGGFSTSLGDGLPLSITPHTKMWSSWIWGMRGTKIPFLGENCKMNCLLGMFDALISQNAMKIMDKDNLRGRRFIVLHRYDLAKTFIIYFKMLIRWWLEETVNNKQAGTELSQAQLKLGLDFNSINSNLNYSYCTCWVDQLYFYTYLIRLEIVSHNS